MYFALLRTMAVRKVNIVELISTFTELTFLVKQADLNELFHLMNSLMKQNLGSSTKISIRTRRRLPIQQRNDKVLEWRKNHSAISVTVWHLYCPIRGQCLRSFCCG